MTNFKKTFVAITLVGVVWLSAGCSSDSVGEVVEREVEEQLDARDTLPPLVETTTPVAAPQPDYSQSECSGISVEETSIYVPEDWNEWCVGYMAVSDIWDGMNQDERNALCSDFWATPDSDLLQDGMYEWGMTRDQTVGFIDYLWITC